jgi:hypothetical protein
VGFEGFFGMFLDVLELGMAENGGFEPPIELSPYNGLANRRLQPLGQLSVCLLLERNLVAGGFFALAEAIIA